MYIDGHMCIVHHESVRNPMYNDMLRRLNNLIQKYSACKVFIDGSASNLIHELKHQTTSFMRSSSPKY
jgi:hypothetical protein